MLTGELDVDRFSRRQQFAVLGHERECGDSWMLADALRAHAPTSRQVADHLRPGGSVLLMHSSVCGVQRTLDELAEAGLRADVVTRRRGPLGSLLRERAADLWATGALAPGSLEEEIVVVRGRRPAAEA